jgi:hypothetical protein
LIISLWTRKKALNNTEKEVIQRRTKKIHKHNGYEFTSERAYGKNKIIRECSGKKGEKKTRRGSSG